MLHALYPKSGGCTARREIRCKNVKECRRRDMLVTKASRGRHACVTDDDVRCAPHRKRRLCHATWTSRVGNADCAAGRGHRGTRVSVRVLQPLFLHADLAFFATVAPRVDKRVIAINAHNFAMIRAFLADDFAGAEFNVVNVEFERLPLRRGGVGC